MALARSFLATWRSTCVCAKCELYIYRDKEADEAVTEYEENLEKALASK